MNKWAYFNNKLAYKLPTKLLKELLIAFRFAFIGCLATLVHITVVTILLQATSLLAFNANLIAFVAAFSISFIGNYYWTFRNPGQPFRAILRFFLISIAAFFLNMTFLLTLLKLGTFPPLYSTLLAALIIPFISFLGSRLWCFKIR